MTKQALTLGKLRQYVAIISFVSWALITVSGCYSLMPRDNLLYRFFLGPLAAGIGSYFVMKIKYRALTITMLKDAVIEWTPLTYGTILLPIIQGVFFFLALALNLTSLVNWIPTTLLVYVGMQYAFFSVAAEG